MVSPLAHRFDWVSPVNGVVSAREPIICVLLLTFDRHELSPNYNPIQSACPNSNLNLVFIVEKIELRKDIIAKKKRKSRTAFTNHQIFELEKR